MEVYTVCKKFISYYRTPFGPVVCALDFVVSIKVMVGLSQAFNRL